MWESVVPVVQCLEHLEIKCGDHELDLSVALSDCLGNGLSFDCGDSLADTVQGFAWVIDEEIDVDLAWDFG
jgi:hypothetical protein